MSRETSIGTVAVDHFPAFENDGYTKRSGLSVGGGDFTVSLYKDGVVDATTVTIAEIGSLGEYKVSFTPASSGVYVVEVLIDFNGETWVGEYVATTQSVQLEELYQLAGLDSNDRMAVNAEGRKVPPDGSKINLVFEETAGTVTVQRQ